MKKRLLSGIILLVFAIVLSAGASFAALFEKSSSASGEVTVENGHTVYYIANQSVLFGIGYNEKYNDYAAVTEYTADGVGETTKKSNRIVLLFTQDIKLSADIVINRDVNIDLNGHTLDLSGHTLTVRHAYFGQFALYSSVEGGAVVSTKSGGQFAVQTPNAEIKIDDSVADESSLISTDNALASVALEYIKNVFKSGGAGMYYTSGGHLPFVYRYGIHELDIEYTIVDGAVSATIGDQTAENIAVVASSAAEAAKLWLADYMQTYANGIGGYDIYHTITLPSGNNYTGTQFTYSATDITDNGEAAGSVAITRSNDESVYFISPAATVSSFTLNEGATGLSFTFITRSSSYRNDIAADIITAILTREDEKSETGYSTANGIILTAIYGGQGEVDNASSYLWSGKDGTFFTLPATPSGISMGGVGDYTADITADALGLDGISYEFVDGNPANVYALNGYTVGFYNDGSTIKDNAEIFESLEMITATLKVTLTIDEKEVVMNVMIGFSWSGDETITGDAGTGSPSNRFGAYFNRLQSEINAATDNLSYNKDFEMRANFDGDPYIVYSLVRVDGNGNPIADDGLLTVLFDGKTYTFSGDTPSLTLDELKAEGAKHIFKVDYSLLPICGAYYRIYVHYSFGTGWAKVTDSFFTLYLPGIVQVGRGYDADGNFADNGTVYFVNDDAGLYEHIRGLISPDETYIQTADLTKEVALYLHTSDIFDNIQPTRPSGISNFSGTITGYNWLTILPNITVLDVCGRKFGDSQLSLLTDHNNLKELYIGGYSDDINANLTALDNLPSLPALEILDISYSKVSLFDRVTKANYPALKAFWCGGITIDREINLIIFSFTITDWRYGSNGTQNRDTLAQLVAAGVSVNNGGSFGEENPIEKALAQIITQENIMVNAANIPMLYYYVGGAETSLTSYTAYLAAGSPQLYYSQNGAETAIDGTEVGTAFNALLRSVEKIYVQFPNDNTAIAQNNGEGGTAASSYGFQQLSAEYVNDWGSTGKRNYLPLIGMQLDEIAYDADGAMEAVTIRISYYTAIQNGSGNPLTVNEEAYFVQHELGVVYSEGNSDYQDIVYNFKDLAKPYLTDYVDSEQSNDWKETNALINNLSQIMTIIRTFSDNEEVIINLYNLLGNGNEGDDGCKHNNSTPSDYNEMYTAIFEHFDEWYAGIINKTVENFKATDEFTKFETIIGSTRNAMSVYDGLFGFNSTDGFWIEGNGLNRDNYANTGSYKGTDNATNMTTLINNYNGLADAVKISLEESSYSGRENYSNVNYSFYNWLVKMDNEMRTTAVSLSGIGSWGEGNPPTGAGIIENLTEPTMPENEYGQISVAGQSGMLTMDEINQFIFSSVTMTDDIYARLGDTLAALNSTDRVTLGDYGLSKLQQAYDSYTTT